MTPLFFILSALFCTGTCFAQQWAEVNPPEDLFNNTIRAIVTGRNGVVYAAGQFTDSTQHYVVATLVNGSWKELGGVNNLKGSNQVYALALDSAGNLYAAGYFADGAGKMYVAKWDGQAWSELGTMPYTGPMYCLAADKNGNVYAAGDLTDATGNMIVEKWNGQGWSVLGTGAHALNANGLVYSLYPDGEGNLYAAGDFTDAGGHQYVAEWNGSDWSEVGSGANALNAGSWITSLGMDAGGDLYAAGDFKNAPGYRYVAKWNGSGWSEVGSGAGALLANNVINALTIDAAGRIVVGGGFSDINGVTELAEWAGGSWVFYPVIPSAGAATNFVRALAIDGSGAVYAGGDFTDRNGDHFVGRLLGSQWSEPGYTGGKLPTTANGMAAMVVDTAGRVFVLSNDVNFNNTHLVYFWNGVTWSEVSEPYASTNAMDIQGLAPDSLGNLYAAGMAGGQVVVLRWTGSGWSALPVPGGNLMMNFFRHIATDKQGNVYVCGGFRSGGADNGFIIQWNGAQWQRSENSTDCTYFIVGPDGTFYADTYTGLNNVTYNLVAVKNGVQTVLPGWPTVHRSPDGTNAVEALTLDPAGNLYISGSEIDSAGSVFVTRWDGQQYVRLGSDSSEMNGSYSGSYEIRSLVFDNAGNLYAAGMTEGGRRAYLGKWDGKRWTYADSSSAFGYQLHVPFLGRDGRGNIYAGGAFDGSVGLGEYVFVLPGGAASHSVPSCTGVAKVTITTSADTVTDQSPAVILKASVTGAGATMSFVFAKDRNFVQVLQAASADSVLALPVDELTDSLNTLYVRLQTTNSCDSVLTATDSILIVKKKPAASTGTRVQPFAVGPNPFDGAFHVTGLDASKSYALYVIDGQGDRVIRKTVTGQANIALDGATLKQGIYWLEVYDNASHKRTGRMLLLKIH